MNWKVPTGILATAILTFAVLGALQQYFFAPQHADVQGSVTFQLDGSPWTNNTLVEWGVVEAGQSYASTFRVDNIGTVDFIVTLIVDWEGMTGWTMAWPLNGTTIAAGTYGQADLTLSVPNDATPGASENWSLFYYLDEV